jgi:hypothetical protein
MKLKWKKILVILILFLAGTPGLIAAVVLQLIQVLQPDAHQLRLFYL